MLDGERIAEVEDGEDKADEFPEGDDQGDHQRGTLSGQFEDTTDTDVPEPPVKEGATHIDQCILVVMEKWHIDSAGLAHRQS